ncbi:MAG: SH3 domain-containing protein [Coleofasciculus sp. Co-bin14]|nr:SH3 domain-containing protein [Coleofasciculus sp. Co-bin14]
MKKMSIRGILVALLALMVCLLGGLNAPAFAITDNTRSNSVQTAQLHSSQSEGQILLAQAAGECRAANRKIDIFSQASVAPNSTTVRSLEANQTVTLAGGGSNGWVPVSAPATGYVIARYLKTCGTTPPPPPPPGSCRRVIAPPEGLVIRAQASSTASQIGGIGLGELVRVTGQSSSEISTGRRWVEITAPSRGWISSGRPEGNLSEAFTCP